MHFFIELLLARSEASSAFIFGLRLSVQLAVQDFVRASGAASAYRDHEPVLGLRGRFLLSGDGAADREAARLPERSR